LSQGNELIKIVLWHFYELSLLVPLISLFYFWKYKVLNLRMYKFIREPKTLFEWIGKQFKIFLEKRDENWLFYFSYIQRNPKDIEWNLCDKNLLSRRGWNSNAKIFICAVWNFIFLFYFRILRISILNWIFCWIFFLWKSWKCLVLSLKRRLFMEI
jgi:hypothetical protein